MADIFISYKREERERVAPLARELESRGYSVWWDLELVTGEKWTRRIKAELDAAKCVIVVWSELSVGSDRTYNSEWVENEADEANRRGVLLPVLLDDGRMAWTHQKAQYADLVGWKGDAAHPGITQLIAGVVRHAGARTLPNDAELIAWQDAEARGSGDAFRKFLSTYPASRYAAIALARAEEIEEEAAKSEHNGGEALAVTNTSDPLKGQFGGSSVANGRKITAKVLPTKDPKIFLIKLKVGVEWWGAVPLFGDVEFHFPDRWFKNPICVANVDGGAARIRVRAWGAFTVGARCDNGKTQLDLSELEDAPIRFRNS